MARFIDRNGIRYFKSRVDADAIAKELLPKYPEVRVVSYKRGLAVQYRISGPYYPQLEPDFRVSGEVGSSVYILWALSEAAEAWVAEHIPEDAISWGRNGTAVEHRYIGAIVDGIIGDGLSVEGR